MKKGYWITKEGDELAIEQMETSHIKRCVAMLERNMPEHEEDEVLTADHWSISDVLHQAGAKTFRDKIAEFTSELAKR
jgi:hypothetical protein